MKDKHGNAVVEERSSVEPDTQSQDQDYEVPRLFVIPKKSNCDSLKDQYETYACMLWKLRDEVIIFFHLCAVNKFYFILFF